MDFKRPTEQPSEDIDARFEQRHEVPRPLETVSQSSPTVVKKTPKGYKFLTSLLIVLFTAATAYAAYLYMDGETLRSKLSDADTRVSGLTDLNASLTKKLSDTKAVDVTGGKDFVPQTQMSSGALASVEAFMSTKGVARTTYEASVPYMDADFARVKVDYTAPDAATGKNKPTGKGEVFYFKRVKLNNVESWAMIGINPATEADVTSMKNRYGVPSEVITGSKPA